MPNSMLLTLASDGRSNIVAQTKPVIVFMLTQNVQNPQHIAIW